MAAADGAARAAIEALGAAVPAPEEPLLFPPTRFDADDSRHGRMVEAVRRDRAGRPPGAQNKATKEIKDLIRRLIGDPLFERARWAAHTPESLAAELGCTKLEAFDRLDRIRNELAPYFYARLAPTDEQGRPVVPLVMAFGGHVAAGDARPPWEYLDPPSSARTIENIEQIAVLDDMSHGAKSHGDAK